MDDRTFQDIIGEQTARIMYDRAQEIERQLLDHDVVAVPYGDQFIIFRVPSWRRRPIRRARIAWYRWRRRRQG